MNVNHSEGVNSLTQAFVIVSSTMGIYLGCCSDLTLWSKYESAGQSSAVTFRSISEAEDFMKTDWEGGRPDGITLKPVFPDDGIYASIRACVAAGLEAWAPEWPALMDVVLRRREILEQEGLSQGLCLVVGLLDISDQTDEELHVTMPFEFEGHTLSLTYSLGYDADEDGYRPYVEIAVGTEPGAPEFSERRSCRLIHSERAAKEVAMEEAFAALGEEAGDLCVKALAWCQAASEKRRNHQVAAGG